MFPASKFVAGALTLLLVLVAIPPDGVQADTAGTWKISKSGSRASLTLVASQTGSATFELRNESRHPLGNDYLGTGSYIQAIARIGSSNLTGGPSGMLWADDTRLFDLRVTDPTKPASVTLTTAPNAGSAVLDGVFLLFDLATLGLGALVAKCGAAAAVIALRVPEVAVKYSNRFADAIVLWRSNETAAVEALASIVFDAFWDLAGALGATAFECLSSLQKTVAGKAAIALAVFEAAWKVGSKVGALAGDWWRREPPTVFTVSFEPGPAVDTTCVPTPLSPAPGAVLDNGRLDGRDKVEWTFSWTPCPGASDYGIILGSVVVGGWISTQNTSLTVTGVGWHVPLPHSGLAWQVRANYFSGGQFVYGSWSDPIPYAIEPRDTDPPGSAGSCPDGSDMCWR